MHIAFLPAHTLTVTTTSEGRELDWTHPGNCPQPEDQCEYMRRIRRMDDNIWELAEGRPDGVYQLCGFGFHSVCLIDDDGHMLPAAAADEAQA